MPIDTRHPQYEAVVPQRQRVRDTVSGTDAIKGTRAEVYLPKLGGQEPKEYEAYKNRALFVGITGKTLDALEGAIMRKAPVLEAPEAAMAWETDMDGKGTTLAHLCGFLCREALQVGAFGLLADFNGRPFAAPYVAERITNWLPSGAIVLEEETLEPSEGDPYKLETDKGYRELLIEDGKYTVNVWSSGDKGAYAITQTTLPDRRGDALQEIPFAHVDFGFCPLLPLVDVNLSHYRSSADLEHGRHFTALPTPWISGLTEAMELNIGSTTAWTLPAGGQCGMLEFTGAGLTFLENALGQKEKLMAVMGAALLLESAQQKTATEARINEGGRAASLVRVIDHVEQALNRVLRWMADWAGITGDIKVTLNRDLVDASVDPQMLSAMLQARVSGNISLDTWLRFLDGAEVVPGGVNAEDEKALLDSEGPKSLVGL